MGNLTNSTEKMKIVFYTENEKVERCVACNAEIPVGTKFGVIEKFNYVVCRSCADNPKGIDLRGVYA